MSDSFFEFTLTCPHCGDVRRCADGFETDDWTEVFVFSGYSRTSAKGAFREYTCPACGKETARDSLYAGKYIKPNDLERVKAYFDRMLEYVMERGGIYDHGWDPDIETAIRRYASLDPQDGQLQLLRKLYYYAYHDPGKLVKCEPYWGTRATNPDMVLRPGLLKKIYLPDGLAEIGDGTFRDCGRLKDAFIPRSVSRIGIAAFENCSGLCTVRTPDNLRLIGSRAFFGCGSLKSLFLPNGLAEIGAESFRGCRSLSRLFIPAGCTQIGENAFADCPGLILCGRQGSAAERYAAANGLVFTAE